MKTKTNYYSNSLIGIPHQQFAEEERSVLTKMDTLISQLNPRTFFSPQTVAENRKLLDDILTGIETYYSLPKLKDPIRAVTGNYYFLNKNTLEKAPKTSLLFEMFSVVFTPLTQDVNTLNSNKIPTYSHKNVKLQFSTSTFDTLVKKYFSKTSQSILKDEKIKNEVISLFINKLIELLTVSTKNDYTKFSVNNLVDQAHGRSSTNILSLNENYNFFIQRYEETFNQSYDLIAMMPNYYCLNQYVSQEEPIASLQELVSLQERVKVTELTIGSEEYYTEFVNNLDTNITNQLATKLSSYVLDSNYVTNPRENLSTEMMPYVNEFSFVDDNNNIFSEFLTENNLSYLSSINIHNSLNNSTQFLNLNSLSLDNSLMPLNQLTSSMGTNNLMVENKNYQVVDYLKVFNFNSGFLINQDQKTFYFSDTTDLNSLTSASSIFKFLKLHNLVTDLVSQASYASILNGNDLPNYCISYTVDKFDQTVKKQTVSLTRDNNASLHNFIDSQIIYDKNYEYIFNLNTLINNIEYNFQNVRLSKDNSVLLDIQLSYNSKIIKCPFGTFNTKMIDRPPIPVDIKFYPFYGINNKIKILLNSQTGRLLERPVILSDTDNQFFDKHKKNQFGKIMFESDDNVLAVQLFRTTDEPFSYKDFQNVPSYFVDFVNTNSVAYDDFVTPNTKYYYLFRTLDVHNQISNPSSIYEVQIIDNDGAVYPIIKEHIFRNKQDFNTNKSFKKYLQLSPAFSQKLFNFENGAITFSEQEQQLWGQKFKIRIKSKKSGKVIDLNVLFDKKEIKIN